MKKNNTTADGYRPDTQHVVVEEHFGLEADLDEVGDDLHVVSAMRVAVHTQRHQQVLSWTSQLQQQGEPKGSLKYNLFFFQSNTF